MQLLVHKLGRYSNTQTHTLRGSDACVSLLDCGVYSKDISGCKTARYMITASDLSLTNFGLLFDWLPVLTH